MLALLQKRLVVALIAVMLVWFAGFCRTGHIAVALAIFPIVAACYMTVLGMEFVALGFVQRCEAEQRASIWQLTLAWLSEAALAPLVFCWRQPFRSHAEPDTLDSAKYGRRGVVLVHGLFCNRGFWGPWLKKLRAKGIPAIAINLEPLFGSIDDYAFLVESAVAKMEARTGLPVVLAAHSMGGLAVRAWLRRFDGDSRVHRVVTIGTPHQGTWLARHSPTVNGRQMRIGSTWLRQLAANEPSDRAGLFTCCFSRCDNIVFPAAVARLPGATSLEVAGAAHVQLAFEPAVFDEVLRWLVDETRFEPS